MPPSTRSAAARPTTAAAVVRTNAAAAAAASAGSDTCDLCARVGLPILPLRYAVVPNFVSGGTADPTQHLALGASLKGKPPGGLKAHRYTIRTLRKGYVMVYMGSGVWQAYSVSAGGHLRQLADPDDPDHAGNREISAQCKRAGHNVPASFINIAPLTVGATRRMPSKIWVAFSDVLWTAEVRKQYEGSGTGNASRAKRMQEFTVDQLGKQADALPDAFQFHTAHEQVGRNLSALVWEYATDATQAESRTRYNAVDSAVGSARRREKWGSAHPLSMRTGEAAATAEFASRLTPSNRDQLMASAIVLHDPLGMVQELNATRAFHTHARQTYLAHENIARPLLISQSIVGLKTFIGEQQLAKLTAEEKTKNLPDTQTHHVTYGGGGMVGAYIPPQTHTYTDTRRERAAAKTTRLWSDLQDHYREADRAAFEKQVAAVLKKMGESLVATDADYAAWLDQPEWIQRKHDFDSEVPAQQDQLIEAFAAALNGGPGNDPVNAAPLQQDIKTYEVWVKYLGMDPMDEHNPLYVALFGNQKDFLQYLMPEGANPAQDSQNKGSKLYKVIKTVIGTKELRSDTIAPFKAQGTKDLLSRDAANKVPNPIRAAGAAGLARVRGGFVPKAAAAAAHVLMAIAGALGRMAANAIKQVYEATALRAMQAAVLLYERREIHLVTTKVKVREYLAYLNDMAFGARQSLLDVASKGMRRVVKQGQQTVRSMAVAGTLFIADSKVKDTLIEVLVWVHGDLDNAIKGLDEVAPAQEAASTARSAAQSTRAAENAAMLAAMSVHPFTLSPQASSFVQAVSSRAQALRLGSGKLLTSLTRSSLRLVSTGSGILAVGSLAMQGWSLKDNIKKADKAFLGSNEARVLVTAAGIATLGAMGEVLGVGAKLASKSWATAVGRVGGALGALASIVEGVQAGMAAMRSGGRGDYDAMTLYGIASVTFVAAGALGIYGALTGAALLGPIGWALALIVIAVIALHFAAKAEDSQAAMWLDRCYWGKGLRFQRGNNAADRPWTHSEVNQELSQLNAVILGLSAETGFNDDGWGFADWTWDTVKAKVRFPNYSATESAFEWRLRAMGAGGAGSRTLAKGEHGQLPDDPSSITVRGRARPAKSDTTEYFRNLVGPTYTKEADGTLVAEVSVEVRVKYFQDVELTVDYVPDVSDPQGRASLALSERDGW